MVSLQSSTRLHSIPDRFHSRNPHPPPLSSAPAQLSLLPTSSPHLIPRDSTLTLLHGPCRVVSCNHRSMAGGLLFGSIVALWRAAPPVFCDRPERRLCVEEFAVLRRLGDKLIGSALFIMGGFGA